MRSGRSPGGLKGSARTAARLFLLAVLLCALAVRDRGSPARANLIAALGAEQPVGGRFFGFDYGLPLAAPGGGPRLAAALRAMLDGGGRGRSPAAEADGAVADLLGNRRDEAIARLEAAVARARDDPALAIDLAAAYLARGGPHDAALACGEAGRAVALAPFSPEARYDLALALTESHLWRLAARAWGDYLALDARSGWAVEARRRRRALSEPFPPPWGKEERRELALAVERGDRRRVHDLVSRFRYKVRDDLEKEVLPGWAAAASARNDREAGRLLAIARSAGRELAQVESDPTMGEAVDAIDGAVRHGGAELTSLVGGLLAYRHGHALADPDEGESLPDFETAAQRLASLDGPFATWAILRAAIAHNHRSEYWAMLATLAPAAVATVHHPALRARWCWLSGLAHLKVGEYGPALQLYQEALALYAQMGEEENVVALHALIAECLRLQGESGEAWKHRAEALSLGPRISAVGWVHNALFDAAEALLNEGNPEAALAFQDEMVERAADDQTELIETLLRRARTRSRLHDLRGARADLAAAQSYLKRFTDLGQRRKFEIDVASIGGEISLQGDPREAARQLGAAIDQFEQNGEAFRLPPLYRQHAQALLASDDASGAAASLVRGIDEVETERRKIREAHLAQSFFDQVRGLFTDMVSLRAGQHQDAAAFAYAERARARGLLDALESAGPGAAPLPVDAGRVLAAPDVMRRLPRGTALVEYAFLDDRALAWVARSTGLTMRPLAVSRGEVVAELGRLNAGGRWTPDAERASESLYDQLVRPLRNDLAGATAVAIVPDGELYEVPFAALRDRMKGKYLVEDFLLSMAPSATLWARSLDRRRSFAPSRGGELIVGDPDFERAAFASLASLAGAREEAGRVAALYPGAESLTGADATPAAFLARAGHAPMIHLASHALVDEKEPLLSAFVLAPSHGAGAADAGLLYARDIYRLRLDRTGLVVLAACDTAGGPLAGSEGVASLVRPFLAAGAPLVVASLWQVDDAPAARLFDGFHRRVARGEDPVAALHDEQVAALGSTGPDRRSPAFWGTFEIFGAAAPQR